MGRHLHDLALGLTNAGVEAVLCGPALPPGVPAGFPHRHCEFGRAIDPLADASALARLGRIFARERPDLIHAHSSKAGAVARLARLARPRTPLVYTPHGYAFAGHFSSNAERLAYRELERCLTPLASRVLCVCEAEARLARSLGARGRVRVVHNGIAAPADGPVDGRMAQLAARGPVLGALTLLRPGKGLETLIDAAPAVLARHPDTQIAIWGDGPDLADLKRRAESVDAAHAVHFLGPCNDPFSALRGVHCFVHPSWAEAFPYVILEAMAVGAPIVASDVGGVGEALVNGDSGVLVPPADAASLAGAIGALLDDPVRAARIGAAARERVRSVFTLERMLDGVLGVYGEALS